VFPVRYELNSYISFRRNSVFKGLSISRQKYTRKPAVVRVASGREYSKSSVQIMSYLSMHYDLVIGHIY
jgi:hypothetical protein